MSDTMDIGQTEIDLVRAMDVEENDKSRTENFDESDDADLDGNYADYAKVFRKFAIKSADVYYSFLQSNNKGIIEYNVDAIKEDSVNENGNREFIVLRITGKIGDYGSDSLQIKLRNRIFSSEEVAKVSFNYASNEMIIRPQNIFYRDFVEATPADIKVIVDLKFLVKRVRSWYYDYGERIGMPQSISGVQYFAPFCEKKEPSQDQLAAISGAMKNPFSYIWGAPGTGKTQIVLAHCICSFLYADKKILITAPTNNAVEQMLNGVLSALDLPKEYEEKIFRLGVPSYDFFVAHPNMCENRNFDSKLKRLQDELAAANNEKQHCQKLMNMQDDFAEALNFKTYAERLIVVISKEKKELLDLFAQREKSELQCSVEEGKLLVEEASLSNTRKYADEVRRQIQRLNEEAEKHKYKAEHSLFAKKHIQLRDAGIAKLAEKVDELNVLQSKIDKSDASTASINNRIKKCKINIESTKDSIIQRLSKINDMLLHLSKYEESISQYVKITANDSDRIASIFSAIKITLSKRISEDEAKFEDLIKMSASDLSAHYNSTINLIKQKEGEIALLNETESLQSRLKSCTVLAATVDSLIANVSPGADFIPVQIFLDEAGYCPLIKAITLFGNGCPVTFLGDHMQLPPICEINDEKFTNQSPDNENRIIPIWAQSSLYCEDVLEGKEPLKICSDYVNKVKPQFKNMKMFTLNHTYRFGSNLAKVLADHVYTKDFTGEDGYATDVYYINAASNSNNSELNRINKREAMTVRDYVVKHKTETIGIITPYKNQKEIIQYALRHPDQDLNGINFSEGRIFKEFRFRQETDSMVMTVHGSQGREWDTVIFSVVDTDNMFFTNTNCSASRGLNVVNTAVSRAKKKLIIVCDTGYWVNKSGQLICEILKVAKDLGDK